MATITQRYIYWRVWWERYEEPDTLYFANAYGTAFPIFFTKRDAEEVSAHIARQHDVKRSWVSMEYTA